MATNERFFKVNGVELAAETFGDPTGPAILLIHGGGHSLLNWDEEFVRQLAGGGRYVIRYDSRDAGRSTSSPAGAPPHDLRTLVSDAAELIGALGRDRVHLVGMSQGAAVAQLLALDHGDKVASLTLASSTPGGPGHPQEDLPEMSAELQALFAVEAPEPDWSDREAAIAYLIEAERPFAATSRPFDEDAMRELAGRVVDRAGDIAAQLTNPYLLDAGAPWRHRLDQIKAPTLVLHGTEDPFLPLGHGRALAAEIPGARFIAMEQTGHETFPQASWEAIIPAILDHTAHH
ncbi:alpha/beta hydrolase [Actinomadura fulvescens]|uniref:AB hydrolase-1 domain-containing protein n=1 Tax=Actinomadura fulvescens TaxID=46160 RepID=A0ABN3QVQ6_9ACTN